MARSSAAKTVESAAERGPPVAVTGSRPFWPWRTPRVSAITVQNILNDNGLGSRYDRTIAASPLNPARRVSSD